MFRSFLSCSKGSIAVSAAVAFVAITAGAGVAIDYARYSRTQTALQSALDSAVLAAVESNRQDANLSEKEVEAVAKKQFEFNNRTDASIKTLSLKKLNAKDGGGTYRVTLTAYQPTTLMRVVHVETMTHQIISEVTLGMTTPVELALVLDVTGSMAGTKIAALKSAAGNLVDTLFASKDSKAKVAIIPFSDYVNVGLANRKKPWLSVPDDYTKTTYQCTKSRPVTSKTNCRKETRTGMNDGVPYTYQAEVCDYTYGAEVTKCGDVTSTYKWNGCVGSRAYPLNTKDEQYNNKIPGLLNISCPAPITDLTDKAADLKKQIKNLSASGNTYIPSGLIWGWRVLSSPEPYSSALDTQRAKQTGAIKAVLLMTDGANVKSPRYPDHGGSDAQLANKLMSETCENMKQTGIRVYTIAFDVGDSATEKLLKDCANSSDQYYDASDAGELTAAFDDIAGKLARLYINK